MPKSSVLPMPFDPRNTDDPDDWSLPPPSSAPGLAQPTFGAQSNPFNSLLASALPPSIRALGAAPSTFSAQANPFNSLLASALPPSIAALGAAPSTFSAPANPFNSLLASALPPSIAAFGAAPSTFGAPANPFNSLLASALPPSIAALGAAPSALNPRPSPFNSVFTNLPPSDPLSPYFGAPPDRLRAGASVPPTFPDAFGRSPPLSPPAPSPLPAGSIFSDALKMLAERSRSAPGGIFGNTTRDRAQASGATPIFGGGPFDPLANHQSTALGTPTSAPSQPASSWSAPSAFTTPDPISDPRGNILLSAFRNNLSFASAGSSAQGQSRTDETSDAVSGTSADSADPNVILVGGDKDEDQPEKIRPIDPLTGLSEPRLPDSQKPLPTLPVPLEESSAPASTADETPSSPAALGRSYELKKGSKQFTTRVPFRGKEVTIRLDYPPEKDGIVDLKDYNWWKPGYVRPFLQKVVANNFQEQIQKYQAAHPVVKFKFSQQPPPWVVQAIEQVGGTYIVDPP